MTKIKNILTIVLFVGLITIPQVSAFSLFGFDFGKAWDNLWNGEEDNTTQIIIPNEIFTITIGNISITNQQAMDLVNNNPQMKNILNEVDYNCLYVNTNNNLNISVFFQDKKILNIAKGKYCEDEIFFEESLIEDLKQGFDKNQITTYLGKIEMPMKMYYKLIKAFS